MKRHPLATGGNATARRRQTDMAAQISRIKLRFPFNLQPVIDPRHFGAVPRRLSHRRVVDPALEAL
jgi:hypothetical protein